ncbi:PIG-L family deacetylase [Mycolicibacterium fortuitum]|uniref:PIG-L family deacetylase n=1 Tax=Mycolicibacterium fortuitum TaxID=1766 RepID=UPI001490546A|nr:PIG-L family deacetylase [Mycolicibacterium fortuitum]
MSNAMRFAARPIAGGGTPAAAWAGIACPVLDLTDCPELIVVAPHPDDETLGFGATSAALARRGVRVQVVSVTDGGAAYPGCSPRQRRCLQQRRRRELECAVETLGLPAPIHLDLPDGDVAGCRSELADRLADLLAGSPDGTWCAVTWRGDGHPDHEAAGWAAAEATARTGTVLLEYPLWMWHWAEPGDDAVPWSRMQQARHQAWAKDRKVRAIGCYASQLDSPDGDAVLPPFVVDRLLRVGEVVFR